MQTNDKKLWRKLILVIVLKLIIITAIYWLFMRTNVQKVDDASVEKHLVSQSIFRINNGV